MNDKDNIESVEAKADECRCLHCEHEFEAAELAAISVPADSYHEYAVIKCAACGTVNELRVEPQGGLDKQPAASSVRVVYSRLEDDPVFKATVREGEPPPTSDKDPFH